jgi:hypothetical protein
MIEIADVTDVIAVADKNCQNESRPINRISLDPENAAKGLGQLALSIVNLIHELLEKQAIRRMDNGTLTEKQIDDLGICLMKQSEAIDHLCEAFDISRGDLNIDLGPLGTLVESC